MSEVKHTNVLDEALLILREAINDAEMDMQSDADDGERVDIFDYEICLPYAVAKNVSSILSLLQTGAISDERVAVIARAEGRE